MTIVFYDNSCSMCVGVTGWLSRIDHRKQFNLEPYQHSEILSSYPQISPADCKEEIHIITDRGKVMRGADAMFEIWRQTGHWTSPLAYILRLPPFIWLARPFYRLVAKNRQSIFA